MLSCLLYALTRHIIAQKSMEKAGKEGIIKMFNQLTENDIAEMEKEIEHRKLVVRPVCSKM